MKKIISILALLMLMIPHLRAQSEGYNPDNPGDPSAQFALRTVASPPEAGSTSHSSRYFYPVGTQKWISATPNTGYKFVKWMVGDEEVSTESGFYFTIPAENVVLTAYFEVAGEGDPNRYDPQNPSDPWADGYYHKVEVYSVPSVGGHFNRSSFSLKEGDEVQIYAYPNDGYRFEAWVDGDKVISTSNVINVKMGTSDMKFTAKFIYDPASPGDPSPNFFNSVTGEMVVDIFTPGSLCSTIYNLYSAAGVNSDAIQTLVVVGRMNAYDTGYPGYVPSAAIIDLSRTTGYETIPAWSFNSNEYLTNLKLPACVTSIGRYAFSGCKNLSEITLLAPVPPALDYNALTDIAEGVVVRVPLSSLPLYQEAEGWKDLVLMALDSEMTTLEVTLPEEASDGRYEGMYVEVSDAVSGQTLRYVITEKLTYVFSNLARNAAYNISVRNASGAVFGSMDNVLLDKESMAVTLTGLTAPLTAVLKVMLPDGQDVTSKVSARWSDADGRYLASGDKVSGLVEKSTVKCAVTLPQEMAVAYVMPGELTFTPSRGSETLEFVLRTLPEATLTGLVRDKASSLGIPGASITVSQTINGKYSRTTSAVTDGSGRFSLTAVDAPARITVSADGYADVNREYDALTDVEIGAISLKPLSGAMIQLSFTFTSATSPDEAPKVSNYWNGDASYSLTRGGEPIRQFKVQDGKIVLMEEVAEGDRITVAITSVDASFAPVSAECVIDEALKGEVVLPLVEKGSVRAIIPVGSVASTAMLYDAAGVMVAKKAYTGVSTDFAALDAGSYTLVTMEENPGYNSITMLEDYENSQLSEGNDYVMNSVEVTDGSIAVVEVGAVPELDMTKLAYTGESTLFSVNKPSTTIGNYVTLKAKVDFKKGYEDQVENPVLIVDLPADCRFVDNSVLNASGTASYTLDGTRLTVPLASISDNIRFCIIPTVGGEMHPGAYVSFRLSGSEVMQPIGTAFFEARNLDISLPETVMSEVVAISGSGPSDCEVEVFDGDTRIAVTRTLMSGSWSTKATLANPYAFSRHSIHAEIVNSNGDRLSSSTRDVILKTNHNAVKTVTMVNTSGIRTVFDFATQTVSPTFYSFNPSYGTFTFLVDFEDNSPEVVECVTLAVLLSNNEIDYLDATYSESKNLWVATGDYTSYALPVNVSVQSIDNVQPLFDRNMLSDAMPFTPEEYAQFDKDWKSIEGDLDEMIELVKSGSEDEQEAQKLLDNIETVTGDDDDSDNTLYQDYLVKLEGMSEAELEAASNADLAEIESMMGECMGLLDRVKVLMTIEEDMTYEDPILGAVIVSKTCDGLTPEKLIADGFEATPTAQGDFIYIKANAQTIAVADFASNTYEEFNLPAVEAAMQKTARLLAALKSEGLLEIALENLTESLRNILRLGKLLVTGQTINQATMESVILPALTSIMSETSSLAGNLAEIVNKAKKFKEAMMEDFRLRTNELSEKYARAKAHEKVSKSLNKILKWKVTSTALKGLRDSFRWTWQKTLPAIGKYAPVVSVVLVVEKCAEYFGQLIGTMSVIFPCENDMAGAVRAALIGIGIGKGIVDFLGASLAWEIGFDAGAIITSETIIGGIGCVLLKMAGSFLIDVSYQYRFSKEIELLENLVANLKCVYDPDKDKNKKKRKRRWKPRFPFAPLKPSIDPSGYVYEAVASNRLEGVTATAYYKDYVEDMYGVMEERVVVWDAEEFAQENPLFTDENGMYAWDVPQGQWQVKFEKSGYETTYSEWLPVPPPQLDVNIGMTQYRQPKVKSAHAFPQAVEIEFDKYMDLSTITTDNILVSMGDEYVSGTLEMLDEDSPYADTSVTYASKIRFNASAPFEAEEVTILVGGAVKSYAGVSMSDAFTQTFKVEPEISAIETEEKASVMTDATVEVAVKVLPASASAGHVLNVASALPMIASVESDSYKLDDNGCATIVLRGHIVGQTAVTVAVEGFDISAMIVVDVLNADDFVADAPRASILSGSEVAPGTRLELLSDTPGAVILYTLDGTCPCDVSESVMTYDPLTGIVLPEGDITVKAMAKADGFSDSDVVEFIYHVTGSGIELPGVNRVEVHPTVTDDKFTVELGDYTASLRLYTLAGVTIESRENVSGAQGFSLARQPLGMYFMEIRFSDGRQVTKVVRTAK